MPEAQSVSRLSMHARPVDHESSSNTYPPAPSMPAGCGPLAGEQGRSLAVPSQISAFLQTTWPRTDPRDFFLRELLPHCTARARAAGLSFFRLPLLSSPFTDFRRQLAARDAISSYDDCIIIIITITRVQCTLLSRSHPPRRVSLSGLINKRKRRARAKRKERARARGRRRRGSRRLQGLPIVERTNERTRPARPAGERTTERAQLDGGPAAMHSRRERRKEGKKRARKKYE